MPKNNVKILILLALISFVLMSANIGGLYIYALDEAKNSVCAREMMDRGDWIVPTFNEELRTDKPPLHYYFMRIAYHVFGVNEFSARIFSSMMGVLTILLTYWMGYRFANARTGFYAALVLMSSLHFAIQFHMSVPDPYLVFFMTAGFAFFYSFYQSQNPMHLLISYLSFALGTLAKGPIAVALPGLSILIFLIARKELTLAYIAKLKPLLIIVVFCLVILPWYLLVALKTDGEWIRDFFFTHNVGRYTSTMEGHGAYFFVTSIIVLAGLLPFSIFILQGFRLSYKDRMNLPFLSYILVITLTIVLFFSFSQTKLPNYTVPAYPFAALIIAYFISKVQDNIQSYMRGIRISTVIYFLIMLLVPAGLYFGLSMDPALAHLKYLAWYFLSLPLGALITLYFMLKVDFKGIVASVSVTWIVTIMMFFYIVFPVIDQQNPIAKTLNLLDKEKPVIAYRIYNPAYSFYIQKQFPVFKTTEELKDHLDSMSYGYLITRTAYESDLAGFTKLSKITEAKDIFEIPTTLIYRIEEK